MKSLNEVTLMGHLGKDPEVRYTPDGTAVAEFSLATSESWTDKHSGEKKERTEWHTVTCWAKLAELAAEYLQKGAPLYVRGSIRTETYEREGQKVYRVKILARNFIFLGPAGQKTPRAQVPGPAPQPQIRRETQDEAPFDDDIPF